MAESQQQQGIPTRLSCEQFQQFVLPHLTVGSRGPAPKLTLLVIFNYILRLLYLGCQWKELPIEKGQDGRPEIHYTRIYSAFRKWQADGCFDAVFAGSVLKLHRADLLDTTVIHGNGTTTSAKKGGAPAGHPRPNRDRLALRGKILESPSIRTMTRNRLNATEAARRVIQPVHRNDPICLVPLDRQDL